MGPLRLQKKATPVLVLLRLSFPLTMSGPIRHSAGLSKTSPVKNINGTAAAGSPVKKPVDNRMSKDIRISAQCGYYEQDSSWAVSDKKNPKNSNRGLPFRTGFAAEVRVTDSSCYEATENSMRDLRRLATDLIANSA